MALVNAGDIARQRGLTPRGVHWLRENHNDWPAEVTVTGNNMRLWDSEAVDEWFAAHPYAGTRQRRPEKRAQRPSRRRRSTS